LRGGSERAAKPPPAVQIQAGLHTSLANLQIVFGADAENGSTLTKRSPNSAEPEILAIGTLTREACPQRSPNPSRPVPTGARWHRGILNEYAHLLRENEPQSVCKTSTPGSNPGGAPNFY
jgi:hypothetical protein